MSNRERALELMTDHVLVGLDRQEEIELGALLRAARDHGELAALDRAASAVALASVAAALEPIPAALAASLEERALLAMGSPPAAQLAQASQPTHGAHFAHPSQPPPPVQLTPSAGPPPPAPLGPSPSAPRAAHSSRTAEPPFNVVPLAPARPRKSALAWSGWISAAACLVIAIGAVVWAARRKPITIAVVEGPTAPATSSSTPPLPSSASAPVPAKSAVALRDELVRTAGTIRAPWSPTKDPAGKGAVGEVVWNAAQQKGTMTFQGLAKNDPSRTQYQLWIFDKTRDDKYPVDGGVFDVDTESGEVVVPIRAVLKVDAPVLFAVTVERPGGVVVSKRERIVVAAKPLG